MDLHISKSFCTKKSKIKRWFIFVGSKVLLSRFFRIPCCSKLTIYAKAPHFYCLTCFTLHFDTFIFSLFRSIFRIDNLIYIVRAEDNWVQMLISIQSSIYKLTISLALQPSNEVKMENIAKSFCRAACLNQILHHYTDNYNWICC